MRVSRSRRSAQGPHRAAAAVANLNARVCYLQCLLMSNVFNVPVSSATHCALVAFGLTGLVFLFSAAAAAAAAAAAGLLAGWLVASLTNFISCCCGAAVPAITCSCRCFSPLACFLFGSCLWACSDRRRGGKKGAVGSALHQPNQAWALEACLEARGRSGSLRTCFEGASQGTLSSCCDRAATPQPSICGVAA